LPETANNQVMSEYMQRKKPDVFKQPSHNKNSGTQDREAQLRELLFYMNQKPKNRIMHKKEEETRNGGLSTFVVPEGWGLKQIADHLNISTDELKTRNKSKLQNWNGVEGFFAGEKIVYSTKSGSLEKEEEKKEVAEKPEQIIANAYSSYTNDEITVLEFSKAILPYVESHGSNIAALLITRGSFSADSLAFALAQNSPKDSDLVRFDRNVLEIMADQLDTQATGNKEDNQFQKQRIDKILKLNLTHQAFGLKEIIENEKGEEEKIKQIITYVRKQFEEYPPKVKALKESPNFTPEQKVKIAGKISVQAAKSEFLMGTIYHKGKEW